MAAANSHKKWSKADMERLRVAWLDPSLTGQQVADELGHTLAATQVRARQAGHPAKPNLIPAKWAVDSRWGQRLRDLFITQDKSFAETARILSREMRETITRSMVASVAARAGWRKTDTVPRKAAAPKVRKPEKTRAIKKLVVMANTTVIEAGSTEPRYVVKDSAWLALPGSEPKDMFARTGCKWPVGSLSGADQLFCCEPTEATYCAHHASIAFASTGTAKELARGLRNIR